MSEVHDKILAAALEANHEIVMSIDPGATCGVTWAIAGRIETATIPRLELIGWLKALVAWSYEDDSRYNDWNDPQWQGDERWQHASTLPMPDHLVIEAWRLYKGQAQTFTNSDMPEPRLIGRIEMVADLVDIPITFQGAAVMKTLPWLKIGTGPHEQDAAKHLVRYLIDQASDIGLIHV